jgi:hypothetical protein
MAASVVNCYSTATDGHVDPAATDGHVDPARTITQSHRGRIRARPHDVTQLFQGSPLPMFWLSSERSAMREVPEKPKRQYFRIFGNKKFHIATKYSEGSDYYCLCGLVYSAKYSATPISEYLGDECMSCRHSASKKRTLWTGELVLEVKIRGAAQI